MGGAQRVTNTESKALQSSLGKAQRVDDESTEEKAEEIEEEEPPQQQQQQQIRPKNPQKKESYMDRKLKQLAEESAASFGSSSLSNVVVVAGANSAQQHNDNESASQADKGKWSPLEKNQRTYRGRQRATHQESQPLQLVHNKSKFESFVESGRNAPEWTLVDKKTIHSDIGESTLVVMPPKPSAVERAKAEAKKGQGMWSPVKVCKPAVEASLSLAAPRVSVLQKAKHEAAQSKGSWSPIQKKTATTIREEAPLEFVKRKSALEQSKEGHGWTPVKQKPSSSSSSSMPPPEASLDAVMIKRQSSLEKAKEAASAQQDQWAPVVKSHPQQTAVAAASLSEMLPRQGRLVDAVQQARAAPEQWDRVKGQQRPNIFSMQKENVFGNQGLADTLSGSRKLSKLEHQLQHEKQRLRDEEENAERRKISTPSKLLVPPSDWKRRGH